MKYEIYDQETGKRIGNTVKTTRAAERMVTLIHKKTGRCPDYRPVKEPLSWRVHKDETPWGVDSYIPKLPASGLSAQAGMTGIAPTR